MINLLLNYYKRKARRRFGGYPLMWCVWQPEEQKVKYTLIHDARGDEYLETRFKEIADHMRKYYSDWEG